MRLDKLRSPSLESSPKTAVAARYRRALYALTAVAALHGAACGPSETDDKHPDGGMAGSAGEAGTGGTGGSGGIDGGAGAGGEAGGDPCANIQLPALAEADFEVGEEGTITISGLTGAEAAYNGITLEIKDGDLFTQRTRVRLERLIVDNYPQTLGTIGEGQTAIGDLSGLSPKAVDADQPFESDGNDNCEPNYVAVNDAILSDPQKMPVLKVADRFGTVFNITDNSESTVDKTFTQDGTELSLHSLSSLSGTSSYVLGNSLPAGSDPTLKIRQDGKLEVDATGVTDEGVNSDLVLSNLQPSADGVTFEPVPGEPGKYQSMNAYSGTALDLSWSGLNEGLVNDTVTKNLAVEQPNHPPVINSLVANPNPTIISWPTAVSFNVTEPDGDPVNWTLIMDDVAGPFDKLSNPDNGSCNGLTCSGTLPAGGGTVNLTYDTGNVGTPTMTLNVDDGKGGTDTDQEVVQIN